MRAVIYDQQGNIYAVVSCPDDQVDQQPWASQPYLSITAEQDIDMSAFMVIDGQLSAKPVDVAQQAQEQFAKLRSLRNILLAKCDWTQMPDSPLSVDVREKWATYRQALRDFPSLSSLPFTQPWPDAPTDGAIDTIPIAPTGPTGS